MALFLRRMPVPQCIRVFEDLAKQLFERPQGHATMFGRLCHLLKSWYTDECCDANALETFLRAYMGSTGRMFDHHPSIFPTKVGVTAATVDADPIIFTNYNGMDARTQRSLSETGSVLQVKGVGDESGYKLIRPENIEDEPYIGKCRFSTIHLGPIN